MTRDLYVKVSSRIVAELEAGAAPWVKPWAATPGMNIPCNAVSNRPYSGCNVILLWMAKAAGYCILADNKLAEKAGWDREILAKIAERVVALTLAGPPADATHWTGAAMAKAIGISVSSVQRIWRAHGLQPHRVRQFKLSNDPQFVAKLRDTKWALLYIERWLTAPMGHEDGTKAERESGTPQGGVVSPILSNLFLHYTFDLWMARTHPDLPWCRYADDGLVHCRNEQAAQTSRPNFKRAWQSAAWSCIRQKPRGRRSGIDDVEELAPQQFVGDCTTDRRTQAPGNA